MIKSIFTKLLGRLLFLGNNNPGSISKSEFYSLKEDILKKYAIKVGFDIQHIPGKICFNCAGTGTYIAVWGDDVEDSCDCITGYFKDPVWNLLYKYKLGRYSFHMPAKRYYSAPIITEKFIRKPTTIQGYINHGNKIPAKKSILATLVLFAVFRKTDALKDYFRTYSHSLKKFIKSVQSTKTSDFEFFLEDDIPPF